jgi:hypothetical protein
VPAEGICTDDVLNMRLNTITTFITDIILLLIMLIGLLRLGFHESGVFNVGNLMWKQVRMTALLQVEVFPKCS